MKIYIGNDHGGYEAKCKVVKYLTEKGYEVIDEGSHNTQIVRYPYFAARVAKHVATESEALGILICSTGIGMSIIANKFRGIRAALCTSSYMAKMTKRHNNSNILCLGGKTTGEFEIYDMLDQWLEAEYEGGRHNISLGLISETEAEINSSENFFLAQVEEKDQK